MEVADGFVEVEVWMVSSSLAAAMVSAATSAAAAAVVVLVVLSVAVVVVDDMSKCVMDGRFVPDNTPLVVT